MDRIANIEKMTESVVLFRITSDSGRVWMVHSGTSRKLGLHLGDELDPEVLSTDIEKLERAEARESAVRSLSMSGRSRSELLDSLVRKGFARTYAEDTVAWAVENGFIDEYIQLEDFIESRINREGAVRLKQKLLAKGYDKSSIDAVLKRYDDGEAQFGGALELARKKAPTYRAKDSVHWKDKLWAWLYGKGYSSDVIRKVMKEL